MKDINATVLIDLKGKTEEDVLKNLEYSRRKNLQKAKRNGLSVELAGSEDDYKKCYELYSQIMKDGGSTPLDYGKWRNWSKEEKWNLFAIKKENQKIGYYSVINITKRYYGLDSDELGVRPRVFASDKKYSDYRVNDLIYWSTILYGLGIKA